MAVNEFCNDFEPANCIEYLPQKKKEKKICPWCQDVEGQRKLSFAVVDIDINEFVRFSIVKFCPFCGKRLVR